jgi:hypothetical protein
MGRLTFHTCDPSERSTSRLTPFLVGGTVIVMGLFDKKDKKRRDDFDSPVDSVDLNSSPVEKSVAAPAPAPAPAPAAAPNVVVATQAPTPAAPAPKPAPAPPPPETDNYGIEKAIELMRTLPTENIQLVVQVVKFSLESVGIKLPVIIGDAIRRQTDLRGRVDVLKSEIADLETEIKQRKDEIEKHETDYKETTTVRERLEMAEAHGKPGATPAPDVKAAVPSVRNNPTTPPTIASMAASVAAPPAKK